VRKPHYDFEKKRNKNAFLGKLLIFSLKFFITRVIPFWCYYKASFYKFVQLLTENNKKRLRRCAAAAKVKK